MTSKRRRPRRQRTETDASPLSEDAANRTAAEFSKSLVFGDVSDEERKRLILLTPDPPPEVLAQYPAIAEMRRTVDRILFHGTTLSDEDQKIVALVLRKRGFSAFNAAMELMNRLPRVQDQIDDLVRRGVPERDLVSALLMTPQELQRKALGALPRAKEALGQKKGHLTTLLRSARQLGIEPDLVALLEINVQEKTSLLVRTEVAIKKFEAATTHLMRKSKTPLIGSPRVRVARLLIAYGLPPAEAFRTTADLLRSWHPERFRGLDSLQVRRSYGRHIRAVAPPDQM